MKTHEEMVREFMMKHNQGRAEHPTLDIPSPIRELRVRLITEEFSEFVIALHDNDLVKVADGLADLDYVVTGTALAFGIPHTQVFAEVHRSNMTKALLNPGNSKGGKVTKEGYEPANIQAILWRHGAKL